ATPAAPAAAPAKSTSDHLPGSPVLVTGAAGFIGRRVVQLLVKAGHTVRRLDLPGPLQAAPFPESAGRLSGANLPAQSGVAPAEATHTIGGRGDDVACDLADPQNAAKLDAAVQGIRTVVHLAGVMQEFDATIEAVNLNGSKRLIEACTRGDVRRFIYLSSTGADTGRSKYLRACLIVEELLHAQRRMEEMILRCSPVFGVGDHFLTPIIRLFRSRKPLIPCLTNGWQVFNPIFVDDVAAIVGKLVNDEKAPPKTYTLGGNQPVELLDVFNMVQDATKRIKGVIHSPPFLTGLALPIGNLLWPEARMTLDFANTLQKDTLLVQGEQNQTASLLQSAPATLDGELPRVVEQTP
ncbi:MAG: NAD-dependent epimerase/dehydratase family protein, partial [Planctomycetota bacterium]